MNDGEFLEFRKKCMEIKYRQNKPWEQNKRKK